MGVASSADAISEAKTSTPIDPIARTVDGRLWIGDGESRVATIGLGRIGNYGCCTRVS